MLQGVTKHIFHLFIRPFPFEVVNAPTSVQLELTYRDFTNRYQRM